MSTKKLVLILSATAMLSGCGRHYSGVYQGKEQISGVAGTTAVTGTMTLTLNQSSGDSVTGTWQSEKGGAGTINAKPTGDGLTNVQMVMTTGTFATTIYGMYNTAACQQTFTGALSSQNANQLTGTLVSTGSCNLGYATSMSRTIDVTK